MACPKKIVNNLDSEREEGEIVDDADDFSDFSSEEEYLLRQRLQVLESYNNVLERKEAKRSCESGGRDNSVIDLSEISATDFDEILKQSPLISKKVVNKKPKTIKLSNSKQKKRKIPANKKKVASKKKHHRLKNRKKIEQKRKAESSDDDEEFYFRNKRRKLAEAVTIQKDKLDTTSLKARLMKMFYINGNNMDVAKDENMKGKLHRGINADCIKEIAQNRNINNSNNVKNEELKINNDVNIDCFELIDLCADEEVQVVGDNKKCQTENNNIIGKNMKQELSEKSVQPKKTIDSDDDLEMLRQHALKSKSSRTEVEEPIRPLSMQSEDEDSDTRILRVICLKSALLKKAMEMKRKQKLKKRLSQSSNLGEDLFSYNDFPISGSDNNTDIESVDMDIGVSDEPEDDEKDIFYDSKKDLNRQAENISVYLTKDQNHRNVKLISKDDEIEEDEDLLRAKLLISLSNNLPKLISSQDINESVTVSPPPETKVDITEVNKVSEEKRFIINTKDSDTGSDNEATKNLTKMHNKLAPSDFQQRLDIFLKTTRMQVESRNTLPDMVPKESVTSAKPKEKFVPKAVKHLPKSEQQEYQSLVKRMAELEKMKKARQISMNAVKNNIMTVNVRDDPLKPRNVTFNSKLKPQESLEEQISMSRKKIAEESANMLKLKEEGIKLSQKYKIVSTELRNLATAITSNKRQVRIAQINLSKKRATHQMLLKRSSMTFNKIPQSSIFKQNTKVNSISKIQKENSPLKQEKKINIDKSVKVVNNLHDTIAPERRLTIQVDVNSNKKTVKVPKENQRVVNAMTANSAKRDIENEGKTKKNLEKKEDELLNTAYEAKGSKTKPDSNDYPEKMCNMPNFNKRRKHPDDDYQSPLGAIMSRSWAEDPNGVLCPFEVAGECKDSSCKYLHPKPHRSHP